MSDEWAKHAGRLRELSRDSAVRAYLLGRLVEGTSAAELADLVEACLVYRERFGASGNDRRTEVDPALAGYLLGRVDEALLRDELAARDQRRREN